MIQNIMLSQMDKKKLPESVVELEFPVFWSICDISSCYWPLTWSFYYSSYRALFSLWILTSLSISKHAQDLQIRPFLPSTFLPSSQSLMSSIYKGSIICHLFVVDFQTVFSNPPVPKVHTLVNCLMMHTPLTQKSIFLNNLLPKFSLHSMVTQIPPYHHLSRIYDKHSLLICSQLFLNTDAKVIV